MEEAAGIFFAVAFTMLWLIAVAYLAVEGLDKDSLILKLLALILFSAGTTIILMVVAHAAPPPGPLGPRHAWFAAQHSVTGTWCCDVSDGHFLADDDWREASDHYEVRIYGMWWPVPASALRDPRGGPNPTGQAIVWYLGNPNPTIFCFAPGFEE